MANSQATGQCPKCKTPNPYTIAMCNMCGGRLPWAPQIAPVAPSASPVPVPAQSASAPANNAFLSSSISGLRTVALLFIACGIIGLAYFWIVFDVSVSVPSVSFMGSSIGGGRVANLSLMQERSNGLMLSGGAFALGIILYAMDAMRAKGGQ